MNYRYYIQSLILFGIVLILLFVIPKSPFELQFFVSLLLINIFCSLVGLESVSDLPKNTFRDSGLYRQFLGRLFYAFFLGSLLLYLFYKFRFSLNSFNYPTEAKEEYVVYFVSSSLFFFLVSLLSNLAFKSLWKTFSTVSLIFILLWLYNNYTNTDYSSFGESVVFPFSISILFIPFLLFLFLYQILSLLIRSMFWKEFREIRWVWFTSLVILYITNRYISNLMGGMDIFYTQISLLFVLIYTGFIGSRAFAGEKEKSTFDYLHTRPNQPRNILWAKYLIGLFQIFTLLLIVSVFSGSPPGFHKLLGSATDQLMNPVSIILFLLGVYTMCFLVSIPTGDTVRAFLIGFPMALLLHIGSIFINQLKYITIGGHPFIFQIQYIFSTSSLTILVLGLIGIYYYSYLKKRFIWKTGFSTFFLISISLSFYSGYLIKGDMKPIYHTLDFIFLSYDMYYHDHKIYGLGGLFQGVKPVNKVLSIKSVPSPEIPPKPKPDKVKIQFLEVDVRTPPKPVGKAIFEIHQRILALHFEDGYLYTIENYPDNPRLGIYNLLNPKKDIQSINFANGTSRIIIASNSPNMIFRDDLIFVDYVTDTGSKSLKRNMVTIDKKNGNILYYIENNPRVFDNPYLYGQIYDNYCFYYQFTPNQIAIYDTRQPDNLITISAIQWPKRSRDIILSFKVDKNYLYVSTEEHPLEIYDLSKIKYPKKIGETNWDWMDKMIFKQYRYFEKGRVEIKGKRAIVSYNRGILMFDITNPMKPRRTGKMTSDRVLAWTADNQYLYISSQPKGFSIYKIP